MIILCISFKFGVTIDAHIKLFAIEFGTEVIISDKQIKFTVEGGFRNMFNAKVTVDTTFAAFNKLKKGDLSSPSKFNVSTLSTLITLGESRL